MSDDIFDWGTSGEPDLSGSSRRERNAADRQKKWEAAMLAQKQKDDALKEKQRQAHEQAIAKLQFTQQSDPDNAYNTIMIWRDPGTGIRDSLKALTGQKSPDTVRYFELCELHVLVNSVFQSGAQLKGIRNAQPFTRMMAKKLGIYVANVPQNVAMIAKLNSVDNGFAMIADPDGKKWQALFKLVQDFKHKRFVGSPSDGEKILAELLNNFRFA